SKKPDALGGGDSGPTVDAPPLLACTPTNGTTMSTRMIGRVSGPAIVATSPPNDGRLFVIEQQGRIRIFNNEQLVATPFLDITQLAHLANTGDQGQTGH